MFLSPGRSQGEGVPVPAPHLPAAEQYLQGGRLHRGGSDTDDDLSAALRLLSATHVAGACAALRCVRVQRVWPWHGSENRERAAS